MKHRYTIPALLGLFTLTLCALSCTDGRRYDQAICALIDVSGTYADQKARVVSIVKREILPGMVPGDTLLVIRIDSESYEKDNIEALVTLDPRPSRANAQKLALARKLDEFANRSTRARHTDILGAMMLGAEYLGELASGSRVMLIFSDLEEDLPAGAKRTLAERELEDVRVVAINVKRLQGDKADPQRFRERMENWEQRVTAAHAAEWRTVNDSAKLSTYLAEARG